MYNFDPIAWTASTDTFAMSRFTLFPYDSMAIVGDYVLLTGDDGIYLVNSGTELLSAVLVSGLTDLGSPEDKGVRDVLIEYIGSPATVKTEDGVGTTRSYTIVNPFVVKKPTTSIAKLGRGVKSRHWRFTLSVDGTLLSSKLQFDFIPIRR